MLWSGDAAALIGLLHKVSDKAWLNGQKGAALSVWTQGLGAVGGCRASARRS
jgi:hypothetical protein